MYPYLAQEGTLGHPGSGRGRCLAQSSSPPECNCPTGSGPFIQEAGSELQNRDGKAGECCGESGSALAPGETGREECPQDVGVHLPTGLSATGPSANTIATDSCTGVSDKVTPAPIPTGLSRPDRSSRAGPPVAPQTPRESSPLQFQLKTTQDSRKFQILRFQAPTHA